MKARVRAERAVKKAVLWSSERETMEGWGPVGTHGQSLVRR